MDPRTREVHSRCLVGASRGFSLPPPLWFLAGLKPMDPLINAPLRHLPYIQGNATCVEPQSLKAGCCGCSLVVLWLH